jgi:opacity protein-like surface antigen
MKEVKYRIIVLVTLLFTGQYVVAEVVDSEATDTAPEQAQTEETVPSRKSSLASPRLKAGLRKGENQYPVNGVYIAAYGGANIAGSSETEFLSTLGGATSQLESDGDVDADFNVGIKIGYSHYDKSVNYGDFQIVPTIELEASYIRHSHSIEGSNVAPGTSIDAEFQGVNVVANGILKFHNRLLTPYMGFGGGIAWIDLTDARGTITDGLTTDRVRGAGNGEGSQFIPLIQGIVGLEKDIVGPNLTLFIEYKPMYYPDGDFSLQLAAGNSATLQLADFINHSAHMGLRWNF